MEQKLILIMSLNSEYLAYQETLFSRGLVYATGVTLLITALFGLVFAQILNKFLSIMKLSPSISKHLLA
ncbi:hypothetical protein ACFSJQ_03550 [Vibrio olivae]